jgi:protein-S-isoprenylcysteine O-methyltransferase Ste14
VERLFIKAAMRVSLRIPPLAVVLLTAVLMWLSSRAVPALAFRLPVQNFIAIALALAGAVITILGVMSFARTGTTVNPLTPEASSSLVTSGVYRISRNPMYLGFLFLLLAWGIYLSNGLALLLVPSFVVYMNRFQIAPEESALRSRFGPEFAAYSDQVRRWI